MKTAPVMREERITPLIVTTGMSAFRSAYANSTRRRESPRARANTT